MKLELKSKITTSKTSSSTQNAKKITCFSWLAGDVQTIYLYLRRSYIIVVARVFYLNKLKKLGRIGKCMLLFQKVKKTHAKVLRLKHIDV